MSDVVRLVERKNPDPMGLIALLEQLLAEAKSGEISEALVIAFRPDGCFKCKGTSTISNIQQIGALEFLKRGLLEGNPQA